MQRRMLKQFGVLALGLALFLVGCGKEKTSLEARWHFVGADGLRGADGPKAVQDMLSAPKAGEVGERMATNSARALLEYFTGQTNVDLALNVAVVPLVADLFSHESVGEVWRGADGKRDVVVAVRVTKERADTWVKSWTSIWSKLGVGGGVVSVSADRGWLFAVSDVHSELLPEFKKMVFEKPLAPGAILAAEGGSGRFKAFRLDITSPKGKVKVVAHVSAPSLAVDNLGDWAVPTQIVRDPLIAFSALRGWGPQLFEVLRISELVSDDKPGQIYQWGNSGAPIQSGLAVELQDPVRFSARAANAVLPHLQSTNNPKGWGGQLYMDTNSHSVTLAANLLNPMLLPAKSGDKRFAILAFGPPPKKNRPPPEELIAELGKPGTLYYDWEITSENTEHWGAILSSFDAVRFMAPPGSKSPAQQWLWGCTTNMGNTVTRVTQTAPGEFDLVRNSDGGLTGMELVLFSRWIDPPRAIPSRKTRNMPGLAPPAPPR